MTIKITVVDRSGELHAVEGSLGTSAMQAIRDAGLDELLAICGGCCSCATCHVYVEEGGSALPAMSSDEDDLLDGSLNREPNSRLSCQLPLASAGDGLRLRIAPEE